MAISITCSSCGTKLKPPENAAGRSVSCPKCQVTNTVPDRFKATPGSSTVPIVARLVSNPAISDITEGNRSKETATDAVKAHNDQGRSKRWIAMVASLCVCLLVITFGIIWLVGGFSPNQKQLSAQHGPVSSTRTSTDDEGETSKKSVPLNNNQSSEESPKEGKSETKQKNQKRSTPPAKQKNKTTTTKPSNQEITKPGKVRVTVTWLYNNVQGTKPDTNAVVVLLPIDLKHTVSSDVFSSVYSEVLREKFYTYEQDLRKEGAYAAVVAGDGKATVSRVPPGRYHCFIVSSHVENSREGSNLDKEKLSKYFKDPSFLGRKVFLTEIEVHEEEETELNHDFGTSWR